ncbi:tRNA uridine(34) 5-carboxymethylaminomethyl modification radical SAM/GNAT enzyme Elp3 [Candidatus Woesearchaeota archaeon]|nr:tRNA uridine(34) 5-carboxymethylaminomethyl modification radical SAM/GNAT enzyme Elp3 [Candidatus Woesearchaeota archaeon]
MHKKQEKIEFVEEVAKELIRKKLTKPNEIIRLRNLLAKKLKPKNLPSIIQILLRVNPKYLKKIKSIFIKPVRTLSGVTVVAVMAKPISCKHGVCIFCPGGPGSVFGDVPQSYTGKEPATMRAIRNDFDSYLQVFNRLEQYIVSGHQVDKVDLIFMSGTFTSFPLNYQKEFAAGAFKAMNDFSDRFYDKKADLDLKKFRDFFELPADVNDEARIKKIKEKVLKLKGKNIDLVKEQKRNESSKVRCIGLTIETKPDYARLKYGNEMLRLGCTRVEVGVQSVYDDILKLVNRGHNLQDTIDSIRELKDLGFKINAHYMLGLPGTTKEMDLEGINSLFSNSDFRPDMLKIYPCLVLKGTPIYELWKQELFAPITTEEAAEIISEFKRNVPYYARIMRVQRDIPTYMTKAGVDRTNLRQYVEDLARRKGIRCMCIRCREAGRFKKLGKLRLFTEEYEASKGKEFFISIEDAERTLVGFCRLRFPSQFLRPEITKTSALIRELHVYGTATAIGEEGNMQHKGYGKKLMKAAEDICKKNRRDKLVVISGIGVREYYSKKLGYKLEGPYMVKFLLL